MNGLYPIIRRVRRPLVPMAGAAGGADAKPAPVPVVPAGDGKSEQAANSRQHGPQQKHGKATSSEPAK